MQARCILACLTVALLSAEPLLAGRPSWMSNSELSKLKEPSQENGDQSPEEFDLETLVDMATTDLPYGEQELSWSRIITPAEALEYGYFMPTGDLIGPIVIDEHESLESEEMTWKNSKDFFQEYKMTNKANDLLTQELEKAKLQKRNKFTEDSTTPKAESDDRIEHGGKMCKTCVELGDQALSQLEQIIIKGGAAGCAELCAAVPLPSVLMVACNVLCDVVGIKKFIKVIKKADLDAIYYCQLLKACPYNDHGDANITDISVSPKSGPQGDFVLSLKFTTENGTSTGQLYVEVFTVDKLPVGAVFFMKEFRPGTYSTRITIQAKPDKSCDPTQTPCEQWLPGQYLIRTGLCAGKCGSKHPHSKVYDMKKTTFTITSQMKQF